MKIGSTTSDLHCKSGVLLRIYTIFDENEDFKIVRKPAQI